MTFLSTASRDAITRLLASDSSESSPPPLDRVRDIRRLVTLLEGEPAVVQGVRDALEAGATWHEVAESAALRAPAAKWRWQGTDEEIAARHEAGRARAVRASSVPVDLPGRSVAEAAEKLGVTVQAVYLGISRGRIESRTIELANGRRYKRVFLEGG